MPKPIFFTNTPEKDIIRTIISKQFDKWLTDKPTAIFNGLASDQWIVEGQIVRIAKKQKKKINLHNFETNWSKVGFAFPWYKFWKQKNVNLTNHIIGEDRFFRYIQEPEIPVFSWADYCGTPLKKEIIAFKKAVRPNDVIYVTFSLNPRFKQSIDKQCLEVMEKGKENWSICAGKLTRVLEKYIRQKIGKNFSRILFSFYVTNAGKRGQTPMITVGWHFRKNSTLGNVSP